jgi:hypothetical protein
MSKKYTLEALRKMKSNTDLVRAINTSELDIMEQSIADPDTPYLTDEELKELTTPGERQKSENKYHRPVETLPNVSTKL